VLDFNTASIDVLLDSVARRARLIDPFMSLFFRSFILPSLFIQCIMAPLFGLVLHAISVNVPNPTNAPNYLPPELERLGGMSIIVSLGLGFLHYSNKKRKIAAQQ